MCIYRLSAREALKAASLHTFHTSALPSLASAYLNVLSLSDQWDLEGSDTYYAVRNMLGLVLQKK